MNARAILAALASLCATVALLIQPATAATPGLIGTYFNNATLTGPPALVRVDSTVNFLWLLGSPDSTVNVDNFSVRWVGTVRVAVSGNYNFQTVSDDGVRLTVNGTLVIDDWTSHAATTDTSAAVALTAGVDYPITLEYYENILTATMQLQWKKPGDLVYSTIPASNGSLGLSTTLTPALEYRFEEASWNGSSGEVRDTSASGWNGTAASLAATKPTTANATPAVGTIVGTCGYGVFNRANKDYVALPSTFQNLGSNSSFTVTAWIRSTDVSQIGQRIFLDDENGATLLTAGYGLSLGDPGSGRLRFYTRATTTTMTTLDTAAVITNNVWYFVAFSVDYSAKLKRVYVYDTSGAQLAAVSASYFEANIGADNGTASIGGETNSASGGENTAAFGFGGNIDEVRVYPWALATADLDVVRAIAPPCPAIVARTPGGFNAFEGATAAGSITGAIHTKVAGGAFALDVVALNAARSAVLPGFYGTVKVELLDASNSSGALDAASGCRASWTPLTGNVAVTPTVVTADSGRKSVTQTEPNAWRDVRLRISFPATGAASAVGCSTDDFAIRPNAFTSPAASDADWQTAGSARSLANASASGGVVHKAGRPFTLSASAVNAAGPAVVTSNYTGTPGALLSACAGTGCPAVPGTLSVAAAASAGVISSAAASYSEAGSFSLQLVDSSWAAVDASDGSTTAERNIVSPVVTVGRFVPDHFDLAPLITPVWRTFGSATCAGARSFTYAGQPFGWATAPQATVLARNAAGTTTALYAGAALWKLTAAGASQAYTPLASATPGLDSSGILTPALTSNGNGTGVLAAAAGDVFKVVRSPTTPLNPFSASFGLTWSVTDASEAGVSGNGSIATTTPLSYTGIAFDAGNLVYYGVLKLGSAYGSELVALAAPIEAQYWDGTRFATNTADNCTTLSPANAALGNYQRSLAACKTTLGSAPLVLASGRASLRFTRPGSGNAGSVDATLNLGASATGQTCGSATVSAASAAGLAWLQGRTAGVATFDQNPSARISFGQYRSPLVQLRESF